MRKTHHRPKLAQRVTTMLLAAILAVGALRPVPASAAEAGATTEQISTTTLTYPQDRSFAEINQYYKDHPYDVSMADVYDIVPDMANEELNALIGTDSTKLEGAANAEIRDKLAGKLSDATLTNALNATNFMRYHAGLQLMYIHTNDKVGGRQWRAQAGAALLAELGTMTHNVSKADALAAGISEGLYGWAKAGPAGSNCVNGYGVAAKMVNSFMPDVGNDGRGLSHRSYILNPGIAGTGFGAANLSGTNKAGNRRGSAVTMFITYGDKDPYGISAVMWPSQRQPIETFLPRGTWTMNYPEGNPYQGNPWSFFFNYGSVDTSKLKVTLESNGQTEVLEHSKLTETQKKENRLFTSGSNPLKKLIAFRPSTAFLAGDKVTVWAPMVCLSP